MRDIIEENLDVAASKFKEHIFLENLNENGNNKISIGNMKIIV